MIDETFLREVGETIILQYLNEPKKYNKTWLNTNVKAKFALELLVKRAMDIYNAESGLTTHMQGQEMYVYDTKNIFSCMKLNKDIKDLLPTPHYRKRGKSFNAY